VLSGSSLLVAVWVILAVGCGLSLAWTSPVTAQDQAQPRLNQAAPIPHGDTVVGQTFVAGHNGLSAVELLAVVYPDRPAGLTLELVDAQGNRVAAEEFQNFQHNAPLRLGFSPQPHSFGEKFTLRLSGPADNGATVWAYSLDGYACGTMLVNGSPAPGDLRFSTTYTYLWTDALRDAAVGLARLAVLAVPLWLILFAPGLLLLSWLWRGAGGAASGWARYGLALALSLALLPIVWLWVTVCGGSLSPGVLWAAYAVIGAAVAVLWVRHWRARLSARPGRRSARDLALGLLLLAGLITRLLAVRDLALPAWVDSPHHYTIAWLMAETGRVPANFYPLLPIGSFTYHFGFHALAATMQWLTGMPLADTFLWTGQLLQGLMPLAVYASAVLLTRRPHAGWWAAFIVALVSLFPGYYLTWGRYTELTGLLVLAPLLGLAWRLVMREPNPDRGVAPLKPALALAAVVGVGAAGLLLTHYRVFVFFVTVTLVALALGVRGGWKRLGVAAVLAVLLTLPWLTRLAVWEVRPLLALPAHAASTPGYNDFPWSYFQSPLERGWLLAAGLAAYWGLLRRNRPTWVMVAWVAVTSALLNIGPGTWIVNNNSWAISLFVPGAIVAGWGGDRWWSGARVWAVHSGPAARRALGVVLGGLLAGLAAYAGLEGALTQVNIVNPSTVLATVDDAAALNWIQQNAPPEAVFLVNGWVWQNTTWASPDGAIWLWPLTGRKTTLPPVDYTFMADGGAAVNAFNARAAQIQDWTTPAALDLLRQAGVTHVFIGAKGGNLKPEMFVDKPDYRLLYTNGAAWVFELR
jgi:hypothetical protein